MADTQIAFTPDEPTAAQIDFTPDTPPPEQGGVLSGVASAVGHALNPLNLIKGALDIGGESDISKIGRYSKSIGDVIFGGKPVEESLRENVPEVAQARAAATGQLGRRAQAEELTGLGLQTALLAAPFIHGKTLPRAPGLAETVFEKPPPPAAETAATTEPTAPLQTETAAEGVIQNATQERQVAESRVAEHPGDEGGGAPTETGGGGRVEPGPQVGGEAPAEAPVAAVPDKIVGAALRAPDGTVYSGNNHYTAIAAVPETIEPGSLAGGWVTESGRFIPEEGKEAKTIAGSENLNAQQSDVMIGKQVPKAAAAVPPEQAAPAARPEPEPPTTFQVEAPSDPFGSEATPVSSFVMNNLGGLMSKSTAKRYGKFEGNEALWEDAGPLGHPTHNKVHASPYTEFKNAEGKTVRKYATDATGEMPDVAAQALYDAGLIADPSPTTMWKAISDESKSARTTLAGERGKVAEIKTQAGQAKKFGQAQREGWKQGEPAVPVRDLQVGDTVIVKGEPLKVTNIDPDTFDVTLEDGRKFGVQTVEDNKVLYGEHEAVAPKAEAPAAPGGGVSVPLMITKQMEADLREAGFSQEEINKLTPQQAHDILRVGKPTEAAPPVAETPPVEPPAAPTTTGAEPTPERTGIAERYREEEQPGSVIPGVGVTSEQARTYGHDFINKGGDPYAAVARAQKGNASWQDVGIARAEYERLGNVKRAAEDALEKDPTNPQLQAAFDQADAAQRKWSADAQPILTRAGDALRAATRAYPREINSFSDFTDIVNDHYGGKIELTPKMRADLQKAVGKIKTTNREATAARSEVTKAAAKKAGGGRVMSFDELKTDLKSTVEQLLRDCIV